MKTNNYLNRLDLLFFRFKTSRNNPWTLAVLFLCIFSMSALAQKNKDIIPVVYCIKDLSNGLYQASFGYTNPTKKEVIINEDGSIIKSNNGKRVAKGLNKFKPGSVDKVFTKEFGPGDYVEWTIISNGNTHSVIANANSAKKCAPEDGFIFPVIGNGKSFDIIGQELTSLCENVAGETPSDLIFQINEDKVLVEIVPKAGEMGNVLALLQGAPFNIPVTDFLLDPSSYLSLSSIDVYFSSWQDLCLLNDYDNIINFARPVYPAYNNSGGVITQGDAAQTSDVVRESFRLVNSNGQITPVDGTGVKIGVLSNSYDKEIIGESVASLDVGNGELPIGVEVLKDNSFKSSDEGRAMMQIIHDIAPGANLAFHTATASPRQFEMGFNALKDAACDIIVDDITFITEPFFGIGRISQAVQAYLGEPGKFHFTSAGNFANKAYQSTFNSSSNLPVTNFIPPGSPTRAHVFGTSNGTQDYLQKISVVPGTYLIALQWKEAAASQENQLGATDDLDIYVVDDAGRLLVGNNRVNIAGDPTEIIVFRSTGTGDANILITSANGATNVPFRYIAFRTSAADNSPNGLTFPEYFGDGAPTVSGHAMTPQSITVGAVDYRFASNPVAETFSSYGGDLSDGINLEIDMYAPDGGNTSVRTIGQLANCETCDNDEFLNFYGTSASAPHAAAAMALLKSATPVWYGPGSFTTNQSLDLFQNTGLNFISPDGTNGILINTLNAFKSIASQTAKITSLTVTSGVPSAEPITVSIIGEFFPAQNEEPYPAKVYFDGIELTDIEVISDTEITATIPPFVGNPDLTVFTAPKPGTQGNGGFSDPVKVLPDGKIALNVKPDYAEFEYGQDISLTYSVEGLPLDENGNLVSFESLGLPDIVLSSAADIKLNEGDYPIVFDYVITPSFGDEELDSLQLAKYQINFISGYIDQDLGKTGYLTITKKDLTITTQDVTYTYGDAIDAPLIYSYNEDGISDNAGFHSAIKTTHASDFKDGIPNKFEAIVNKFEAIVNDYDLSFLDGGSWSASERTIENKFEAIVNGMNVISLDSENFINYINAREAFDDGTTNKFEAIVNKFEAIVNAEDLFSGDVALEIENKFEAIVNKFEAIVNEDDPENPYGAYAKVFTIINTEDAPTEDDPDRAILHVYALNMITGLEVTTNTDSHQVYPGTFLNAMSSNFNISYIPGNLTILPKNLTFSIENISISYGDLLTEENLLANSNFEGWAFEGDYQESVATVFPEGIPYYFIKDGVEYEIDEIGELGEYQIKIRDPKNYIIDHTFDENHGTLTINKATLTAVIQDKVINQFEIPQITTEITGFVTDESVATVFPDGIPYYFVDDQGLIYNDGDLGAFTIHIMEPENYSIDLNEAKLLVNSITDTKKIRTYADCVSYDPDGLGFKVIYRYENDNDNPIYVLEGPNNKLSGSALYEGELPQVFIPGSGTFEIRFDGNQLVWSLTTFGSTHNSSVSSSSTTGSGECDAKLDDAYDVYPNPVSDLLYVRQNIPENDVTILVLNMYGSVVINGGSYSNPFGEIEVPVSGLINGLYIVRIISPNEVRTINIIKQ